MDNAGSFAFLNPDGEQDFTIGAAGTQVGEAIEDLEGLQSLAVYALFTFGAASASGAAVQVYIQTSIAGAPWYDIACLTFGEATAAKAINLVTDTPVTTPATLVDQALADDTALDGPIGDRVRAVVKSTVDYSGPTVLSLRGNAR